MSQRNRIKPYDPAEDAALLLMRLGFVALFFGVPIGAEFSRWTLFLLFPIGLVLILGASLLVVSRATRERLSSFRLSALSASALFLISWSLLSLLWSPNWADSMGFAIKAGLTGLFTALTCRAMPEYTRSSNLYLISLGLFAAVFAAMARVLPNAMHMAPMPVFDERAGVTLAVMAWPGVAALAIRRHTGWAGALAILLALALIVMRQFSSIVILATGAIVYSAALSNHEKLGQERLARGLGLAFGALILLAPLLVLVASLFAKGPGSGAFSTSIIALKQSLLSDMARLITGRGLGVSPHSALASVNPVAAHWFLFEIWFDLGVLGALTSATLVYRAFVASLVLNPALSSFVMAGLTCIVLFALSGQGFAQIWWLTLLSATAIAFRAVANGQARTHRPDALKPA